MVPRMTNDTDPQTAAPRPRQRLTKRHVDALPSGQTIWDAEVTGFGVRRQRRDPTFVVKYTIAGRQRFYTVGKHGVFTVEQARTEARRLLGLVASGIDPAERRDAVANALLALSVAELCARYLEQGPIYKPDKRASSWYTDASNLNRHIVPLIGKTEAERLQEADVVRLVANIINGVTSSDEKTGDRGRAIVKGGKGVAARSLAVLGAAYQFGIRAGLVTQNPTKNVKAPRGASPGRFLTVEEWGRLGAALYAAREQAATPAFIDAVSLLAMTGCRRSEITQLKWSEVDLRSGLLRLEHSKVGPRVVPLGDAAVELLKELQAHAVTPWVFPSNRGLGPIVGLQKVWTAVRKEARLSNVRLHDLRHSFASQAVNGGASLYLTGAILGHRQSSTTQRYAHLQSSPVREVATNVSKGIAEALGKREIIGG
jgi:integrase